MRGGDPPEPEPSAEFVRRASRFQGKPGQPRSALDGRPSHPACPRQQPAPLQLQRPDGRTLAEVEVPSPVSFLVEGRPTSGLVRELAWYLESFLDYPFSPVLMASPIRRFPALTS